MSLQTDIHEALADYLRTLGYDDVEYVVSFEDKTINGGYCETCSYEEAVVDVKYRTLSGGTREWTYYGSFAELIRNL